MPRTTGDLKSSLREACQFMIRLMMPKVRFAMIGPRSRARLQSVGGASFCSAGKLGTGDAAAANFCRTMSSALQIEP